MTFIRVIGTIAAFLLFFIFLQSFAIVGAIWMTTAPFPIDNLGDLILAGLALAALSGIGTIYFGLSAMLPALSGKRRTGAVIGLIILLVLTILSILNDNWDLYSRGYIIWKIIADIVVGIILLVSVFVDSAPN